MSTNVPDLSQYDTDTSQTDTFNNEASWANNLGIKVSVFPTEINTGNIGESTPNYPISIVNNSRTRSITIESLTIVGSMDIVAVNGITSDGSGNYIIAPQETMTVTIEIKPNLSGIISGGLYINTLDAAGSEFVKVTGASTGIDTQIKLLKEIEKQYQAEGYNVVGNFLEGCVLNSENELVLNSDYKLWSYSGSELFPYIVEALTVPSTPNYTQFIIAEDISEKITTSINNITASDIPNAKGGSVQDFIDAQTTTVAELATGKFKIGTYARLTDRAMNLFLLQSGGVVNGTDILDAGNGNTAVYQKTFIIDPCALGAANSPADSTAAWSRAIEIANGQPIGAEVRPSVQSTYRITDEMPQTVQGVILNLAGSIIDADFASGWAFRIGNQSVTGLSGIINGTVTTSRTETTLNGVLFSKNVRRLPKYDGLRVSGFKGTGVKFQELNWSAQDWISILVENCGNNLWIDDNGNALNICAGLDGAVNHNLVLRGVFSVNVVGGYNQNAGISGILIDNGQVGSLQISTSINIMSYMEKNGQNHIIARNGLGLNIHGTYFKCIGMTGSAIKLENWTGANIIGNIPTGLSDGTQRDFLETDATCTQIYVGQQHVTTPLDAQVNISSGGSNVGIINLFNTELTALPTGSNLTKGSQFLLRQSGQSRARPWIFLTDSVSNRIWREVAIRDRKQTAQGAVATLTPNLNTIEIYDLTLTTNLTVNAPTGEFKDGDTVTFLFRNSGAGGLTITWNTAYKTSYSNVGNVANSYCTVKFIYSAGRALWIQTDLMQWTA